MKTRAIRQILVALQEHPGRIAPLIRRGAAESPRPSPTPMMRQYFAAKEKHPEDVLLFRMGDFYEMFYDDARLAAEVLGIALTSRSREKGGDPIPMAGVPVKSVDAYIRRLLTRGHRVAVCEQITDPRETKGIVEREVVRVVTPGTFLDAENLDDSRPHHLAAIAPVGDAFGIAWVDLSTGRFGVEDVPRAERWRETLVRVTPVECLYAEGAAVASRPELVWLQENLPHCTLTAFPEWHFEPQAARERLLAHFGTRTLEGFGCEHLGPSLRAAGALIQYLKDTQRQALPHISRIQPTAARQHLSLDAATHRALDLTEVARTGERRGSLLHHLDRTRTAMGARLLREWVTAPLRRIPQILERQDAVRAFVEERDMARALGNALREVRDIERLSSRIPLGRTHGRDLKALESSLRACPAVKEPLRSLENPVLGGARDALDLSRLESLAERIGSTLVDEPPLSVKEGGVIRDGHDAELDELRAVSRDGVSWIARFQQQEAERTGIPNLKVGYNRVFGYYIEITHTHREKIPADYTRKQTLKNAERYITPALKEQENRVLSARERAETLEYELFQRLRDDVERELLLLQQCAIAIATLDAILSLADVAALEGYVAPEVVDEPILEIEEGLHPVLAAGTARSDFTPNEVHCGGEHGSLAVITGPNMAGKSTYVRQTALLTILTQIGSFVPARRACVGIADRIFTRVGAADDLTRGQSTFMVEMTETANILNNATRHSLVILDEVGRGTSTVDGISLAWAIAEHLLLHIEARTLFATHYHELTELEERYPEQVKNLNVAVREWRDEIIFLHKILPGGTDKAYGIHVARLAGIPSEVLARAKDILAHLEKEVSRGQASPAPLRREATSAPQFQQLDLFDGVNEEIRRRLKQVDPDRMTPLEALQFLVELRSLAGFSGEIS